MAVCIINLCVLKTQPIAKSQWILMILGDVTRLNSISSINKGHRKRGLVPMKSTGQDVT